MPVNTLFQLRTLDILITGDVATAQPVNFESAGAAFNAHFLPGPLTIVCIVFAIETAVWRSRSAFSSHLPSNGAKIEGVTWHTLRHTFASRLVMAGVDLKTVQELMGHKTIAMTARYAHLAPTHKLQALETLVRPGSVSVQSGCKLATNTKKATRSRKLNSIQLIESK